MVQLSNFVQIILQLPEIKEQPHFDKRSFRWQNKIVATLHEASGQVVLKLSAIDQSVYCAINPAMIHAVPNKWGLQGWTIIELKLINKKLLEELLAKAYLGVTQEGSRRG